MKKIILICLVLITTACQADEAQMEIDHPTLQEIIVKVQECEKIVANYFTLKDKGTLDGFKIDFDDKQKAQAQAEYDTCKQELQTIVAKF